MVADDPTKPQASGVFSPSATLAQLLTKVEQVAATNTRVLVLGETGAGKGLLAQTIHTKSPRREQAFIPVNCGALPVGLVESELFGHEKGAFTGAVTRRIGFFEQAHSGTLFLDEIGDLPLEAQRVLLHVLEEDRLSDEVLAHLQGYAWPGNVRELSHWIHRAMIVCAHWRQGVDVAG